MLSVVQAIQDTLEGKQRTEHVAQLRWSNDIFIKDKKIGAVFAKFTSLGSKDVALVISIGVNLNSAPISDAISLSQIMGKKVNTDDFITKLNQQFFKNLDMMKMIGFQKSFKLMIEDLLMYKGHEVSVYNKDFSKVLHKGILIGLNDFGHTILLQRDGQWIHVHDGKMRLTG